MLLINDLYKVRIIKANYSLFLIDQDLKLKLNLPKHTLICCYQLKQDYLLAILVFFAPGNQVPAGTGIHGCGVNTPKAAAVADATIGLAIDIQFPNDGILTIGIMSKTVAIGFVFPVNVLFCGNTFIVFGAVPIEHDILAPLHTHLAIVL
ncbi:hypothetical protein GCM10010832_21220 [Psychroflexus planctonicus]|uniref:Uncharacterized protein n=1 Tax=Psychroflexus planctonicus TaxID=1526575 RepID=A0ABQ1SKH5_9FLAO|nr:hypothetical protein GCM10010832_21220 [Psychroflexus planctonicus]